MLFQVTYWPIRRSRSGEVETRGEVSFLDQRTQCFSDACNNYSQNHVTLSYNFISLTWLIGLESVLWFLIGFFGLWNSTKQCEKGLSSVEGRKPVVALLVNLSTKPKPSLPALDILLNVLLFTGCI